MKTNDMLPKTKGRKKKEVIAENPPNKIIIENDYEEIYEPSLGHHLQLYRGDCLQKMKEIQDNSVDLILCDLPYGTTKCKWDTIIDIESLWVQYQRILKKPHGVILLFGQQPFTTRLISSNYKWFKYNFIWKKNKTTQFLLANYRPMKCTEDICVFSKGGAAAASRHKGNMTYNPQNLQPVNIKNLAPNIFISTPTNGPIPIHDKPITETIAPISHGPIPLTSPKKTGNKKIGA